MSSSVIVVHYHEVWLKGRNRRFFLRKLQTSLQTALQGLPVRQVEPLGDRMIVWLEDDAAVKEAAARIDRVLGIAFYAIAQPAERMMASIAETAWKEIEHLPFSSFAVRAKRSDKSFPSSSVETEAAVGRHLVDQLRKNNRDARVRLKVPELTCYVEIMREIALVYARKNPGAGGLPANTAGRMTCLLSGGFDSAVAAYQMMKRGAHVTFVHFYGAGAEAGESSAYVASQLVKQLTPYQSRAKLYRVPFEPIQREIARAAPEEFRVLLYRRMMLRIAEVFAKRDRSLALITGDSLGQVASQTLHNLVAVDAASGMVVFRPLAGTDKEDIIDTAKTIGTYAISAEPFHDCCPMFLPRQPALYASPQDLSDAETNLPIHELVARGIRSASAIKYEYRNGRVEETEVEIRKSESATRSAIA
ncbi:MAG TPA: tRNA uracil 4-sulfurtransferase ThiI [Candidatus Acidoferrales bacterium]